MNITTRLDYPAVPAGEKFKIRLMVGVMGGKGEAERIPVNLALAIDRSGSMDGDKFRNTLNATCMIASMMEQQDVFSLVTFDDKVNVVIPTAKGPDLKGVEALIHSITPGGMTFLSGGYEEAYRQAQTAQGIGTSRIVLLSDGIANEGIADHGELCKIAGTYRQKGIMTTTFGVGADFDEELMTGIAEWGGGTANFIETPEQAADVFRGELEMMRTLSNTDCTVYFTAIAKDISVQQLNTFRFENNGWVVGDVSSAEERFLVLEISLPAFDKAGGEIQLGELVVFSRSSWVSPEGKGDCCGSEQRIPVRVSVVDKEKFSYIKPDIEVMIEAALLSAARAKRKARAYARTGDFDRAAAELERMAGALKRLQLSDPQIYAEIDDLLQRAERLRIERERYFDRLEAKRMMYDADMAGKAKKMHLMAYRQRQQSGSKTVPENVSVSMAMVAGPDSVTFVADSMRMAGMLEEIYKRLERKVPAYSYGKRWCLRESGTGRVFDAGSPWAAANGVRRDDRTLADAGIQAGRYLEVLPLPATGSRRGTPGIIIPPDKLFIDLSMFTGERIQLQGPYQPDAPACDFLARVYSAISSYVPANTYGKCWLLRDINGGRILDTGSAWAQSMGTHTDIRPLQKIGIRIGMVLQAVPLPPLR